MQSRDSPFYVCLGVCSVEGHVLDYFCGELLACQRMSKYVAVCLSGNVKKRNRP